MKMKITFLALCLCAFSFNVVNAQQTWFSEDFEATESLGLATGNDQSLYPFKRNSTGGATGPNWYGHGVYRTTGGNACSGLNGAAATTNHIRIRKNCTAPCTDSGFLVTPLAPSGTLLKNYKFLIGRGGRNILVYWTVDSTHNDDGNTPAFSVNNLSWNYLNTHITTTDAANLCQGNGFVNVALDTNIVKAKRLKLVFAPNTDSDIDLLVLDTVHQVENTPLPVKFASVKAYLNNGGVKIDWNIAAEENVAEYIIERSASSSDFVSVGSVKANNAKQYSYFDASPLSGNNFYRIKVLDKDGSVMYSNILKVNTVRGSAEMNVAPNPVKGNALNVQFAGIEKGTYSLRLVNNVGQQIFVKTINGETSSFTQSFALPTTVAKGIYSLQLLSSSTKLEKKIIIE